VTASSALAFAAAMLVFALSPGPGVVAVISTAVSRGFISAMALSTGLVLGDLVYLLFAVFGLSLIAQIMGDVFIVVRVLGAAYLIWMGIQAWRTPPASATTVETAGGPWRSLVAGFLISLGNPKVMVFYLGFLPAFLDLAHMTLADVALIVAILVPIGLGTMAVYALLAGQARRWLAAGRGAVWMNRAAGALLVGAGVAVAIKS
jgi:threonine/homoserine/homoserine lactone efflux protein